MTAMTIAPTVKDLRRIKQLAKPADKAIKKPTNK